LAGSGDAGLADRLVGQVCQMTVDMSWDADDILPGMEIRETDGRRWIPASPFVEKSMSRGRLHIMELKPEMIVIIPGY
jgi:hypothetical protein